MRVLRWVSHFWTGILLGIVLLAVSLLCVRLVLPLFSSAPTLVDSDPANGASDVALRERFQLRFSASMNPRSVERAISVEPAVEWTAIWNDDNTTLTISPTQLLRPNVDYRVTIADGALGRRFRALSVPSDVAFRTAAAPAVVQTLPVNNTADVPLDSPISVRFSRPIVAQQRVMQPGSLPDLHFDPPVAGSVIWLDQMTLVFRPTTPLRPATRYQATLSPNLADAAGNELGAPFEWNFSTPAPRIEAAAPVNGARLVAPAATLVFTASQPLDLASVRSLLTLSPASSGDVSAVDLPDGQQVIAFTPVGGWQPGTAYTATLAAGVRPLVGDLPLSAPTETHFDIAPRPTITARFPGEGQTLPNGQAISLVFNTPMDEAAFRDKIRFDPPIEASAVRITTADAQVRIAANLQAATVYTMTLSPDVTDRNGISLDKEYQLRFLTAPAGPALALPEASGHLAQVVPGNAAGVLVRRTNLSALNLDLYQLDKTTVVRMLDFTEGEWRAFQPERYSQQLLRTWSVPLSDPLNTPTEDRVELNMAEGIPLPASAYYLRIRTLEGPRADVLLLVARPRLAVQGVEPSAVAAQSALVWATDVVSGTPIAGLPLTLYQRGAPVTQGVTDDAGVFRFAAASGASLNSYVVLSGSPEIAVARGPSGSPTRSDAHQLFLATDRAVYQRGEPVHFAGFARALDAITGALGAPIADEVTVIARPIDAGERLDEQRVPISTTGVYSGSFDLQDDVAPGEYALVATVGGNTFQSRFSVASNASALLQIALEPPPSLVAGDAAEIGVAVRSPEGLPVASAAITWTLTAERLNPNVEGFVFGDDDLAGATPDTSDGTGQTDANGHATVTISSTVGADVPLRYHLRVYAAEVPNVGATAETSFVVAPAPAYAGMHLPSRIATAGEPTTVELLALAPNGSPAPETALRVEVLRRTWERNDETAPDGSSLPEWKPNDQPAFVRSTKTDADGRANLTLTLPSGGAYRLRVSAAGSPLGSASAQTIWVAEPGFTNWGELPGGSPLLIADRASYRPGDTATLLVTQPQPQMTALISVGEAGILTSQMRDLRAGVPFTITIQPDAQTNIPVSVALASRSVVSSNAAAPAPLPSAATTLLLDHAARTLQVSVATDQEQYAPGATATLIITTTNATGAGVAADVVLSVAGVSSAPPANTLSGAFTRNSPRILGASQIASPHGDVAAAPLESLGAPAPSVLWSPALRTDASGVITLTVELPQDPLDLKATVWAAGDQQFGEAQIGFAVSQSLALVIEAPPGLRAGDETAIAARIQNTGAISEVVDVRLSAAGVHVLNNVALAQRVLVAPNETTRVAWPVAVLDAPGASLTVEARGADGTSVAAAYEQEILPAASNNSPHNGDVGLLREYLDPQTSQPLNISALRPGQLVLVRLTVFALAEQPAIAVEEALPAGAAVVDTTVKTDFERVESQDGHLLLGRETSPPGAYQHMYLLRIVSPGRYAVPAPVARGPSNETGVGNAMTIEVQGS